MALKIEQACDWCNERRQVALPKSGPLDLSKVPLPEGWEDKPPFPGGKVGPQDSQQLCDECAADYVTVLSQADAARDGVYMQAMSKARSRASRQTVGAGGKAQSSSFGR